MKTVIHHPAIQKATSSKFPSTSSTQKSKENRLFKQCTMKLLWLEQAELLIFRSRVLESKLIVSSKPTGVASGTWTRCHCPRLYITGDGSFSLALLGQRGPARGFLEIQKDLQSSPSVLSGCQRDTVPQTQCLSELEPFQLQVKKMCILHL